MSTEIPSRNDGVTIACAICGTPFMPSGRRRHCSDACRQAAWRRRHQPRVEAPLQSRGRRRAVTVYECDGCGARSLGIQRCEECQKFTRAVGIGGLCPCCDEPVAVSELVEGGDR